MSDNVSHGFVDWITAVISVEQIQRGTGSKMNDLTAREMLTYVTDRRQTFMPTKAMFGYSNAWTAVKTGLRIMTNFLRPEMGVMIVYDGTTLRDIDWKGELQRIIKLGARLTRLDVTVDFESSTNVAEQLFSATRAGEVVTKSKKFSIVKSNTGDTFYAGSRSSGLFMRCYDKGGQLGGDVNRLWRVELECKGDRATQAAYAMLGGGDRAAAAMIKGFFDAPDVRPFYNAITNGVDTLTLDNTKRKTDTERWLMESVAKTVAKVVLVNPEFMAQFEAAIAGFISSL